MVLIWIVQADRISARDKSLSFFNLLTDAEKSWIKAHPAIRITGPASFPPFHFYEQGQLKGIGADYISIIAEQLNIQLVVVPPQPWDQVLDSMRQKQTDLVSCIAKSDERDIFLQFSRPYISFPLVIVTRKDAPFVSGVKDLHNRKITIINKNIIQEKLKSEPIQYVPLTVSSPLDGLKAVSFGRADAHIENLASASYLIQQNGLTNLKIAAPIHYEDYKLYMAVREDWPVLARIIDKSLDAVTFEQHSQIKNRWLSVRYDYGINKMQMVWWTVSILFLCSVVMGIILFWNQRLKKEVKVRKDTEKNLQKSENRFREIIEDVEAIAIQGYDEERKVTFWNRASEKLYGFSKAQALGKQLEDLIIPEKMREQVIQHHRDWLEKGIKIPAGELTLMDKDQNPVPVYSSHVMHTTPSGKEMFCIDVDLKPVKKAREALKDVDEINIKLMENSPIGISICDETGQCIMANEAMGNIVGASKEQIMQQNIYNIPSWKESGLLDLAESAIKDKNTKRQELVLTTSFGKEIAIDCFLVPFIKQEKPHLMAMISDIFERKKAEQALKENERRYRHLFDHAPAGMYEIKFKPLKFIRVNSVMCEFTGYTEEEFLNMNPTDLLSPESRDLFYSRLEKAAKGEVLSENVEYEVIKKDGNRITTILNSEFDYAGDTLVSARTVAHDITQLKKAQQEKIKAQQVADEHNKMALVGQMAGKMSHDFNNILSIILGTTELAIMDCEEKETRKSLELILDQAIRGRNLTRNLVIFAKDQEPRQEFFFIQNKINLVLDLLKKDLTGIKVDTVIDPQVPKLLADPGMIEHAFVNLLQNAIHALSKTGQPEISIACRLIENRVRFEIRDNGCGIPQEHIANIYEPSFTLKGSRDIIGAYKRGIKGTGYGMSNVKKYIEQHHGSIRVSSGLKEGTLFTIELPIIEQELTPGEIEELSQEKMFTNKAILLVEDEIAVSDIQSRILTHDPCCHRVDVAPDAGTALEKFHNNTYDLVSLDYILPGDRNGLDVYHEIRKTKKDIPILFVSGNIEFLESTKLLKQKDPCIDHISKPCMNREYIKHINHLLERVSLQSKPF